MMCENRLTRPSRYGGIQHCSRPATTEYAQEQLCRICRAAKIRSDLKSSVAYYRARAVKAKEAQK